jgi:hypothetical protein
MVVGARIRYRNLLIKRPRLSIVEIQEKIKRAFKVLYILMGLLLILTGLIAVQMLETSQANITYTVFKQSIAICQPYMQEKDATMMMSRFAAVRTRADFMKIADDLHLIAQSNQRLLPDYQPW